MIGTREFDEVRNGVRAWRSGEYFVSGFVIRFALLGLIINNADTNRPSFLASTHQMASFSTCTLWGYHVHIQLNDPFEQRLEEQLGGIDFAVARRNRVTMKKESMKPSSMRDTMRRLGRDLAYPLNLGCQHFLFPAIKSGATPPPVTLTGVGHKGDPGCCSVTRGRGGVQPRGLKKNYFYNNIYLFLTHVPRWCNFCNVSFNFDRDAKEMNQNLSKIWPEWLTGTLLNLSFSEHAMTHSKLTHWDADLVIPNVNVNRKKHVLVALSRKFKCFFENISFFGLTYPF